MTECSPAVFLDRDGTLIEDVGALSEPAQVQLFPDTIPALKALQNKYKLFIITNQSAVATGAITMAQVNAVHQHLDAILKDEGITIEDWYVCPHQRADNCYCIKPNPTFVLQATRDYSLELERSFIIGDHAHDVETAADHGVFGLYLLTGHGASHLDRLAPDKLVFHRLSDAADWLLTHSDPRQDLERQLEEGAAAIRNGGAVAFPTETVYGLGADAFNADAVARVFEIKQRPINNPLIVHVSDIGQLDELLADLPEPAQTLIDAFWPGPLTIVLPKKPTVPDIVTANIPTVAVRMPAGPLAQDLIRRAGTPIAAPSANAFGRTSPTTARHVREQLGDRCDFIIDGGACRVGVESTVISFTGPAPVVLRPGGVTVEDIEARIGPVAVAGKRETAQPESPGLLASHYAPVTPLDLHDRILQEQATDSRTGFLLWESPAQDLAGPVEVLSLRGDLTEAAVNLYAAIRRLDALGLSRIIAIRAPQNGLGTAVNNRLEKASRGST